MHLDACWANDNHGQDSYSDLWWLTPPDVFTQSHLPKDPQWQLMDTPMTYKNWLDCVSTGKKGFFETGMRLISHKDHHTIRTDTGEVTILLGHEPSDVLVHLETLDGERLPGFATDTPSEGNTKTQVNTSPCL